VTNLKFLMKIWNFCQKHKNLVKCRNFD